MIERKPEQNLGKKITELPEIARPYEHRITTAHVGDHMTVVEGPLGPLISNDDLMESIERYMYPKTISDETIKFTRKFITRSGIKHRFPLFPPEDPRPDKDEVKQASTAIGAHMVDRVIVESGMDPKEIGAVIHTSAVLSEDLAETIVAKSSLSDNRNLVVRSHRTACAGIVTGLTDALTHPDIKGKKVVMVTTELLSHLFEERHFYQEPQILKIFGDNFGAIAFDTNDMELLKARADVIPDNDLITLKTDYEQTVTQSPPDYFQFPTGGQDYLVYNDRGVFMRINDPPDGHLASMKPSETTEHFVVHTPPTLLSVWRDTLEVADFEDIATIAHDPSRLTTIRMEFRVRDNYEDYGISEWQRPKLKFELDKMQRSNSSSGTTLSKLHYMAREGKLDNKNVLFFIAPGIGSVIAAASIRLRK